MSTFSRRNLLRLSAAASFGVLTSKKSFAWANKSQAIQVDLKSEIGRIRPELHSHFAEHLGLCTYGGLWVGKNSPIPNINGHRRLAVEYLKALGVPVLRWPGGCFADDYHWREGIGPAAKRPKRVNQNWGNYIEDNSFGTHEFIELCRLIGAQPYLAGNVGSGTPEELRDWVEYCNYPSGSALSDERAANGSPEPFKVRFWGVGNENWGCGGNMQPQEYAGYYRRYATFMRNLGDTQLFLIACGPSGNNAAWTDGFFSAMPAGRGGGRGRIGGFAMHYYSNGRQATATKFTPEMMQQQLSSFDLIEKAVLEQRTLLDKYDPNKQIGLMVDEWGIWDQMDPAEEKKYGRLWQQITMRGAIAAALGLNVFHRQADKLVMCNIAQIVNVLHAMLLTENEKCIRTSSYYAFELLKAHRDHTSVKVETGDASPLGLSVSASKKDNELILTYVNPLHDTQIAVDCSLAGGAASGGTARIIHHADLNACNTFDKPDVIVPQTQRINVSGAKISAEVPPLSVMTATLRLS